MFFDDPKNALSVARTHQQDLLHQEQRDRLARQVKPARSGPKGRTLSSQWQTLRSMGWWLKARVSKGTSAQARTMHHLPVQGLADGFSSGSAPLEE
jgi:hypothetical protein